MWTQLGWFRLQQLLHFNAVHLPNNQQMKSVLDGGKWNWEMNWVKRGVCSAVKQDIGAGDLVVIDCNVIHFGSVNRLIQWKHWRGDVQTKHKNTHTHSVGTSACPFTSFQEDTDLSARGSREHGTRGTRTCSRLWSFPAPGCSAVRRSLRSPRHLLMYLCLRGHWKVSRRNICLETRPGPRLNNTIDKYTRAQSAEPAKIRSEDPDVLIWLERHLRLCGNYGRGLK